MVVVKDGSQGMIGDLCDVAGGIVGVVKILDFRGVLENPRAPIIVISRALGAKPDEPERFLIVTVGGGDAISVVDADALRSCVVVDVS